MESWPPRRPGSASTASSPTSPVLHDLGFTDAHADGRRFEVSGAGAARAWASGAGLSDGDAQVIWVAIALHTSAGIADVRSPECALVFWGAGVDVAGFGLDQFPPDAIAAVLDALPRTGFTPAFVEVVEAAASRAPEAYTLTWLSATASRCGGTPLMTSEDTLRRDPFDPS